MLIWLALILVVCIAARRAVNSRRAETDRIDQLEEDRMADLNCDGPPRFNG